MEYLKCDPNGDGQEIWKQLIPPIGVRQMFQNMWSERWNVNKIGLIPKMDFVASIRYQEFLFYCCV